MLTIGAFGFNQRSFLDALRDAGVDLFVDIRARRGVRGSEYAFVNAGRLTSALGKAGIPYIHAHALAPSDQMRAVQAAADEAAGVASRKRLTLSKDYIVLYERERMRSFPFRAFTKEVLGEARRPVLFCVETEPEACHRSIVARHLAEGLSVPVHHIRP